MPEVSILIPVYNSRDIIECSVRRLVSTLSGRVGSYEILLRDDSSTDSSKKVMEALSVKFPHLRCFYNEYNRGLGYTLRAMFKDCTGNSIVYCDCDLPFGAGIIPKLVAGLGRHDIVVASRYKGVSSRLRLSRRFFSRMYYIFCRILFNIPVLDIGSGTVAMKRAVIEKLMLSADGFDIHAEIYVRAKEAGFSIYEVPVRVQDAYGGSFSILRHSAGVIIGTLRLWVKRLSDRFRARPSC